jgi:hypothetical protein
VAGLLERHGVSQKLVENFIASGSNEYNLASDARPSTHLIQEIDMRVSLPLSAGLSILWLAATALVSSASDPARPLFYDYPALEKLADDGLIVPADGAYEVWVWGKGKELSITLGEQKFGVDAGNRFAWHRAGNVQLTKDQSLSLAFPRNEKPDDLTNVPGYLALSTDTGFDPKRMPLGGLRTLYDGSGFKPQSVRDDWLKRRESLRRQILMSTGMWPMPPKGPLNPQVYGRQVRDGYTIEKVVLETFPGFYLSGNLYRPAAWVPAQDDPADVRARKQAWEDNRKAEKKPGILSPHGHWTYGRFEPEVQRRAKQLARMGAIVFSYDMVGRGDSKAFGHEFLDPQISALGFSLLALQTWNSIRALDFLSSLPDVDPERICCTGASGGGTQTFILAAIDDRLKVAAPIVMVSQDMQGGCSCENAAGLRIGTDNSEIAALFAPKPQVLVSCTQDWTREFMTKGFPELQATYRLLDAADRVEADIFDFPHNYNQTTRERVYEFLAEWLFHLEPALSKELPIEPEASETISTWDPVYPRPANAVDAAGLKKYLAGLVTEQAEQFRPTRSDSWASTREELAAALAHVLALGPASPLPRDVVRVDQRESKASPLRFGTGPTPRVHGMLFSPPNGAVKGCTLLVHPEGIRGVVGSDSTPGPLIQQLLAHDQAVLAIDTFLTGQNTNPIVAHAPQQIAHYTCYNRSAAAERVRDIVDALSLLASTQKAPVHLIGIGSSGPLCLLARTQAPFVTRTVVDANQFEFRADADLQADQVLPGIVRLGGLRSVGCLAAPGWLLVHNTGEALDTTWWEQAYRLEEAGKNLTVLPAKASDAQIAGALSQ